MACSICDAIPEKLRANTGRDESFPPETYPLKKLDIGYVNHEDLWECPTCGNLYLWEEDQAWTGSGINDEDRLTRLPPEQQVIARACVHGGEVTREQIESLPELERRLAASALRRRHPDLHRRVYLPVLIERLARGPDLGLMGDIISAVDATNAAEVRALLTSTPHDPSVDYAFAKLVETCEEKMR